MNIEIRELPIHFIVGYVRTGSTLLMALLREHPDIETDVQEPNFLHRLCNTEYRYDLHTKCFNIGKHESMDMYFKAVEVMTRLYFDQLCQMTRRNVVVIKHPYLSLRINFLMRMFWKAKFIHILRHPYDALASAFHFTQLHWEAESTLGKGMEKIIENYTDWIMKLLAAEPNLCQRNIRIKYETLIERPAEVLKGLFDYLEVSHDNEMIAKILHKAMANKLTLVGGPLHHSAIGKPSDLFNEKLDDQQRDLIRKKTGYFLEEFEYEPK